MGNKLNQLSLKIVFIGFFVSIAAFTFGYDVGSFGGVQVIPSFLELFGSVNSQGQYALTSTLQSVMVSTPFIGKFIGTLISGETSRRWGRKPSMYILAVLSVIGVLLQTTARSAAQFTVGRIINFGSMGFTINIVPAYMSECIPTDLRGAFGTTLQLWINFGTLIASLVNFGCEKLEGNKAWQIPTGLQFILPIIFICGLHLIPESPRWLISKGRHEEALRSLSRLRTHASSNPTALESELALMEEVESNQKKAPWKEMFSRRNRVRTGVAVGAMLGQQLTGQAFFSQYSTFFYKEQGYSNPFLLSVIGSIIGVAFGIVAMFLVDHVGRRPLLLTGGSLMAVFIMIVGGLGTLAHPNTAESNTIVASMILFGSFYALSWAPLSYIIMSEAAEGTVREATIQLGTSLSVLCTFITSFTMPYLLNAPYADLGAKVGFIYGSICVVFAIYAYFGIPEMKDRSLEEIDELFDSGVSLRKFKGYQTSGVGAQITAIEEAMGRGEGAADVKLAEQVQVRETV